MLSQLLQTVVTHISGTYQTTGADYAEYFESASGESIPIGTPIVFNDNGKIKEAQLDQIPVGVISNKPKCTR